MATTDPAVESAAARAYAAYWQGAELQIPWANVPKDLKPRWRAVGKLIVEQGEGLALDTEPGAAPVAHTAARAIEPSRQPYTPTAPPARPDPRTPGDWDEGGEQEAPKEWLKHALEGADGARRDVRDPRAVAGEDEGLAGDVCAELPADDSGGVRPEPPCAPDLFGAGAALPVGTAAEPARDVDGLTRAERNALAAPFDPAVDDGIPF